MKWEIARIFVVGTGGSGFCAGAAPWEVIGFFMAVAPYSFLAYISGIERGKRNVALRNIESIAKALKKRIGVLLLCHAAVLFRRDGFRSA
jgi:hypothetical protein